MLDGLMLQEFYVSINYSTFEHFSIVEKLQKLGYK